MGWLINFYKVNGLVQAIRLWKHYNISDQEMGIKGGGLILEVRQDFSQIGRKKEKIGEET